MLERYKSLNRAEFGERYEQIKFCTEEQSKSFSEQRSRLIDKISTYVTWGYNNTKADCTGMSEGCRLCGEGAWSCLFINGLCNAKCFYCPASQTEKYIPSTNSVTFNSPDEYIAYLKEFNFKGVSISGGEPLLTLDLTLSYISAVREAFGDGMYIWMYTNGLLVNENVMLRLRSAGLDEIRFDIGATDYKLDKMKKASDIFPAVTVEIPAVPEDFETLKSVIKELESIGVKRLNLHQLRLTPHNFEKLISRNYTYIHNESVTVLESELTALKLIEYICDNQIAISVNYCSFPYKNRYQGLAARKRAGEYMIKAHEEFTESGYIRLVTLKGTEAELLPIAEASEKGFYEMSGDRKTLSIHPQQLGGLDLSGLEMLVTYYSARQLPSVSYKNPFRTVKLTDSKSIVIERFKVSAEIAVEAKNLNSLPPETERFEKLGENLLEYI